MGHELVQGELSKLAPAAETLSPTTTLHGFSPVEIAQLWNVSERTVHRDWDKARLILSRLVGGADLEPWGIS